MRNSNRKRQPKHILLELLNEHGNYNRVAKFLGIPHSTLTSDLKFYGLYKRILREEYKLEDILNNVYPLDSGNLKKKLMKELNWKNQCGLCGIEDWQGKPLVMQLDHIDGNNKDNSLKNLRLLCPNCHAQTDTFGTRNKVRYKGSRKVRLTPKNYKDIK